MLPKGWVNADLIDIITLHDSNRIPLNAAQRRSNPGNYAYYGANGQVDSVGEYIFDGEYILLAEDCGFFDQPERGVAYQVSGKFWVNNHAHILTPKGEILHNYLCRTLNHFDWMTVVSGTTRLKLTQGNMRQVKVPLPPLAEQRRIVAKLDSLTARIARAQAELERARKNAEHIRIASLGKAFHWNETNLPHGWARKKIGEIGDVQLGRQRSPKDHVGPHMRPYVRSANITWDGWDLSDVKEMNFSPAEFETFKLQPGDVLLNEGSGSPSEVGKPAIWNGEIKNTCFQNTVLRVRSDAFSPELLRYVLLFLARTGAFIKNTQGVNIIHIGKAGLSRTCIPVPPISEQPKILKEIQAAFDAANRLQREADRCLTLLNCLESALLTKAFRGKLVPQDPNDEPASVLLDRIRAESAADTKPKRGRKQSTQDMSLPRKRQTEKHG